MVHTNTARHLLHTCMSPANIACSQKSGREETKTANGFPPNQQLQDERRDHDHEATIQQRTHTRLNPAGPGIISFQRRRGIDIGRM